VRISIVSINYAPERTGIGVYTTGMAEFLAADGHDVTVHSGFHYYPEWTKSEEDRGRLFRRERVNGVNLRRSYLYVPARPTSMKRILHELSFVASAAVSYLLSRRTDLTIIVLPPLALGATIAVLAKFKRSATVLHVQDLQPDAAVELGMLKPGMLTRALYALERLNYRLAGTVSTISEGMRAKIVEKGLPLPKTLLFRNWANDSFIQPGSRMTSFRLEWGLTQDHFVALYAGNLGRKQGLESLLSAAALLADMPMIQFVIVGNGAEQPDLVSKAAELGLTNIQFRPLQPIERLSELLATADVSVIPQKRAVTDIVLPSKLSNILASGRPVVAASPASSDLALIVSRGECGILVEPEDAGQMAAGIRRLATEPVLCKRFSMNARTYAEQNLLQAPVIRRFADELPTLASRT
jgi:colanic acid biosynthesis glycosyl transferase WcaI